MVKYLTQAEVKKRAKYKIAEIGSVFAPIRFELYADKEV